MTRLEALVSLNMVGEIGSIRLKRMLEFFGSPENILNASQEKLMAVAGIGQNIASKICGLKKDDVACEFKLAEKLGLKIITAEDADYPENLKNIYDPPIVLYLKGEIRPPDKLSIGIVGSRRASYYGLTCAEKFARELAEKGFTVVSGMARGVDSSAHKGALKAGGRTIAVIGSGFNHLYPPENKKLAEEIAKKGAVVSEFALDTKPLPHNFPRRNRVISGLSLGILVAEAARNSGALITADFALEQGREVFALPGKVDSSTSFGTNGLIKQGAKLVSCVEDILEEFGSSEGSVSSWAHAASKRDTLISDMQQAASSLSERENLLYNTLSQEPLSLDEIVEKTSMSVSNVAGMILRLEMRKLIQQLPGKQFVRSG